MTNARGSQVTANMGVNFNPLKALNEDVEIKSHTGTNRLGDAEEFDNQFAKRR